jgi:hypothetical protein
VKNKKAGGRNHERHFCRGNDYHGVLSKAATLLGLATIASASSLTAKGNRPSPLIE